MQINRVAITITLIALAIPTAASAEDDPAFETFFPFCIDTHDSEKRNLEQQAQMLADIGFDGMGHLWLNDIPERLATLDAHNLKLFQITTTINMAPDAEQPYDPKIKEVMPLLKGRDVEILLIMSKFRSSDESADPRAVEIVNELADIAEENGVTLLLYPHINDWIEKIEDAVRVAKKVNRPNVGVMFNLCHWMNAGKGQNLRPLLDLAMPYLRAVSINGSDTAEEIAAGTGDWLQPLDSGSYDILQFLKTLREAGYTGKIGLQCWGIKGDTKLHLERSMKAWKDLNHKLTATN